MIENKAVWSGDKVLIKLEEEVSDKKNETQTWITLTGEETPVL